MEIAVVAYGRALDMARSLEALTGVRTVFPSSLDAQLQSIRLLRNAYEHIEDRALGQVNGKPDAAAVSIFEWRPLFNDRKLTYAGQEVSLKELLTGTLKLRAFLVDAAADLTDGVAPGQPPPSGP